MEDWIVSLPISTTFPIMIAHVIDEYDSLPYWGLHLWMRRLLTNSKSFGKIMIK